jgi:chemotaxis protein MotB
MSGKCAECEEGLPEWIMSYADMITILMAFFVVMYSMAGATKDTKKEDAVFKSLRDRFGPNWLSSGSIGPGALLSNHLLKAHGVGGANIKAKNKGGVTAQGDPGDQPRVHTLRPGEQASIGGNILFAEGSAQLGSEQEQQLDIAAGQVSGKPQKIEVRGHASRRPLPKGAPYRDNWDLAYARCRSTMERLVSLGIDPKRIRLSVAGDNEPVPAGKSNRSASSRVEVFMLNEVTRAETVPTAQGSNDGQDGRE